MQAGGVNLVPDQQPRRLAGRNLGQHLVHLGGLLLAPLFGTGTINQSDFSIGSLLVSFLGAVILLAIANFFRRRRAV